MVPPSKRCDYTPESFSLKGEQQENSSRQADWFERTMHEIISDSPSWWSICPLHLMSLISIIQYRIELTMHVSELIEWGWRKMLLAFPEATVSSLFALMCICHSYTDSFSFCIWFATIVWTWVSHGLVVLSLRSRQKGKGWQQNVRTQIVFLADPASMWWTSWMPPQSDWKWTINIQVKILFWSKTAEKISVVSSLALPGTWIRLTFILLFELWNFSGSVYHLASPTNRREELGESTSLYLSVKPGTLRNDDNAPSSLRVTSLKTRCCFDVESLCVPVKFYLNESLQVARSFPVYVSISRPSIVSNRYICSQRHPFPSHVAADETL